MEAEAEQLHPFLQRLLGCAVLGTGSSLEAAALTTQLQLGEVLKRAKGSFVELRQGCLHDLQALMEARHVGDFKRYSRLHQRWGVLTAADIEQLQAQRAPQQQ
jgi:hypothetical protein